MFKKVEQSANLSVRNFDEFIEKYFHYIVTAVFLVLSIILITRHELWRDEIQAWMIGAETHSISEFIKEMRGGQGHPYLWNAMLAFISHLITDNIESMKVLHLAISTANIFLFLKYAPFNKAVRLLFVFGYFPFYEYSIISRNYAIGILFMIIFCILYKNKYKNILPISIVLFLMGQTNIYAFVISISLFLMLIFDLILDSRKEKISVKKVYVFLAVIIILAEIFFVYWQLKSQVPGGSLRDIFIKPVNEYVQSAKTIFSAFIRAYIPVPVFKIDFWTSNLIANLLPNIVPILIFPVIIIATLFIIKKRVLFLYIIGNAAIAFIPFFLYSGSTRHYGHFFILFIICLWITNINCKDNTDKIDYLVKFKNNTNKKISNVFLVTILSLSVIGASFAFYFEYRYPFSCAKSVAKYIEDNFDKDRVVIAGFKDSASETVAAYLNKEIYYTQSGKFSRLLSVSERKSATMEDSFKAAEGFKTRDNDVIVIIDYSSFKDQGIPEKYNFEKINRYFNSSIVPDESYYLYIYKD